MNHCWNCKGSFEKASVFCPTCGAICGAYSGDYFDLFGLEAGVNVDILALEMAYLDLQKKTHPDHFALKSLTEQMQAIEFTALLNQAYETLQSPLKTAVYLLKQQGIDALPERGGDTPPQLMMKSFEMHECLDDIESLEALRAYKKQIEAEEKELIEALAADIRNASFAQAVEKTVELKFMATFFKELRIKQKKLKHA